MLLYADYNCLFNSVAQIIMIEKECKKYLINYKNKDCHINSVCFNNKRNKFGSKLRKYTFSWLMDNLETNVSEINKTIKQLIQRRTRCMNCGHKYPKLMERKYASQLEIIGLAYHLNRNIIILDKEEKDKSKSKFRYLGFKNIGFKINRKNINKDIHLYHEYGSNGEHYFWPLFPKIKAKKLLNDYKIKTKKK
jgi:hypothetical protein